MALFADRFAAIDKRALEVLGDDAVLDVKGDGTELVSIRGTYDEVAIDPQIGQLRTNITEPQFRGRTEDLQYAVKGTSLLQVDGNTLDIVDIDPHGGTGNMVLILRHRA